MTKKIKSCPGTLKHEKAENYFLKGPDCWITVRNLAVQVKQCDEGVSVTIYPADDLGADSITETWATYAEGLVDLCDCGHTLKEHGGGKKRKCHGCDCPSFRACD